jgi:hypothetical protein
MQLVVDSWWLVVIDRLAAINYQLTTTNCFLDRDEALPACKAIDN